MWEIAHKIRARYNDVSYHGVRKCVIESTDIVSWLTILPMTNWTFISSGTDTGTSPRISLCHSGFKGLAISSVRRLVTFNNYQSYCLDSSWTLTFLTNSTTSPVFPHQGGKYMYMAIHEIAVNLDNLLSFSWVILVWARYPSYPSQGYPSNANSHKETKEVWTLQPKPSQLD